MLVWHVYCWCMKSYVAVGKRVKEVSDGMRRAIVVGERWTCSGKYNDVM